jgi:hypothetical protein
MGEKYSGTIGEIPPTTILVDEYSNDSTGKGDEGETDAELGGMTMATGRWVEQPELEQGVENRGSAHGKKLTSENGMRTFFAPAAIDQNI